MLRLIATLAVLLLSAAAFAQDLTPRAEAPEGSVAIVGATIHTGAGRTIRSGYVLFEGGTIRDIGSGRRPFGDDARVIDARGMHVYPGLISATSRLGLTEIASVRAMRDFSEVGLVKPEVRAVVAVNPDSTLLPVARTNGILIAGTVPSGGVVPGRMGIIRLDGWTWEDMAVRQDAGLVLNWPNVRPATSGRRGSDAEAATRRRLAEIDALFDQAEAYHAARSADESTPVDLVYEGMLGVLPSAEDQRPIFINASDMARIQSAVTWAVGRGLKPIIVGGRDAPKLADLLTTHDVPVIVNGTHNFPSRNDAPHDEAFTLPKRLQDAGIAWCLTSGNSDENVRNLPYEAATAVAFGLSQEYAIAAITRWPAEILGIADAYGTLEPGKSATLLVTNGSPLEMTTTIHHAFLDGAEVDLSNKQTVLRDRYREKYRRLELIEVDP
ncbi:MAG: imidazolonepropionase [Planctomycetota bacterium]